MAYGAGEVGGFVTGGVSVSRQLAFYRGQPNFWAMQAWAESSVTGVRWGAEGKGWAFQPPRLSQTEASRVHKKHFPGCRLCSPPECHGSSRGQNSALQPPLTWRRIPVAIGARTHRGTVANPLQQEAAAHRRWLFPGPAPAAASARRGEARLEERDVPRELRRGLHGDQSPVVSDPTEIRAAACRALPRPRPRSGPRRAGRCPDPDRDQGPVVPGAAQTPTEIGAPSCRALPRP
ncbi:unnamed protein product [Eretmochelys imbricata]